MSALTKDGFERYVRESNFWEIKTAGIRQRIRSGVVGTPGTLTEKFFDSSSDAKADSKAAIAAKVKQGFKRTKDESAPKATQADPSIEAEIEKAPDDPRAYLVYADVLQARQDPLGELIVLQHQGATKAATALVKKHAEHFWGRLAKPTGRSLKFESQFGFLKSVSVGWPMAEQDGETEQDCVDDLNALLDLPIARFLQRLSLGPVTWDEEGEGMSFQVLIDTLVARKRPLTVRELWLGNVGDWDISNTSTGSFGPLAPLLPSLEMLTLCAGDIDLGKNVSLPLLKHLALRTGSLTKTDLGQLWTLKAPKLESLELWFGDPNYGASGGTGDLTQLLSGSLFPGLKHLGLMNAMFTDKLPELLAKSKVLPKLESLDLSLGTMSDDGLAAMLKHQKAFAHLSVLNLERNGLSPEAVKKTRGLAKTVKASEQDEERVSKERRYPAVGE